jgi:hypothetical protein
LGYDMGWKNIKEHFGIEHNVCVTHKGVCIGSDYIHDLATIDINTGEVILFTFRNFFRERYPALIDATKREVLSLIKKPDTFKASLPVYTFDGGEILEKNCELYGYPNTTHDGSLMFDNTFFQDRTDAIAAAKRNTECSIKLMVERVDAIASDLESARKNLTQQKANLRKLNTILG